MNILERIRPQVLLGELGLLLLAGYALYLGMEGIADKVVVAVAATMNLLVRPEPEPKPEKPSGE